MKTEQIYNVLERNRSVLGAYYAIGIIQLRGGFRISEVLNIGPSQIISDTDLFINADKGSRPRRVHVPELRDLLMRCVKNNIIPFKGISRFAVYRMYKRYNIVVSNGRNKNNSVTHAMRKLYVRDSYKTSKNINITADLVGHKSAKSTEYYVEKEKGTN